MRAVWASIALCAVCLALFGWSAYLRTQDVKSIDELATETNGALCTFKMDLETRYANGVQFLDAHPQGIPGISAADIARSLNNQKATIDALSGLDCTEDSGQ